MPSDALQCPFLTEAPSATIAALAFTLLRVHVAASNRIGHLECDAIACAPRHLLQQLLHYYCNCYSLQLHQRCHRHLPHYPLLAVHSLCRVWIDTQVVEIHVATAIAVDAAVTVAPLVVAAAAAATAVHATQQHRMKAAVHDAAPAKQPIRPLSHPETGQKSHSTVNRKS